MLVEQVPRPYCNRVVPWIQIGPAAATFGCDYDEPMYTRDALRDMHERSHRSLVKLMTHCRSLSPEELGRHVAGFGYPSVRLQIHHIIGGQKYWLSVIMDSMNADEDESAYPDVDTLEAFRASVYEATDAYLGRVSEDVLNTPRAMEVWGGSTPTLVPAQVIVRTQTHIFQHMGQITALCRMFDKPAPPGLDFPLRD